MLLIEGVAQTAARAGVARPPAATHEPAITTDATTAPVSFILTVDARGFAAASAERPCAHGPWQTTPALFSAPTCPGLTCAPPVMSDLKRRVDQRDADLERALASVLKFNPRDLAANRNGRAKIGRAHV